LEKSLVNRIGRVPLNRIFEPLVLLMSQEPLPEN
jgi:hypothetical protein